jgi:hypothetical protein
MFCWFYRLLISHVADDPTWRTRAGLPGSLRRHVNHCTDCRQFHIDCRMLASGLRDEARGMTARVDDRLSERLVRAVYGQKAARRFRMNLRPLAAAACVGLTAIVGVVLLLTASANRRARRYEQAADVLRSVSNPARLFVIQEVEPAQGGSDFSGLLAGPLQNEARNIGADAESAMRFLVARLSARPGAPSQ